MPPYLSIVIPIFNEEANIANLWERLSAVLNENFIEPERSWEVVFTDDGSRDASLDLLAGAELDYTEELMGSYFAVRNPNAKSACGCGTSFSVD